MTRTPRWAVVWTALRAAAALLIAAAVIAQLTSSLTAASDRGWHVPTALANFFSFFTVLSNVLSVIVLLWAVVWFVLHARGAASEPRGLAVSLASVSTYMIITGIVYNTLLRGIPLEQGVTVLWSNEVLHVVGPLFLLLDVLLGPRRRALGWTSTLAVVAFPIVWVAYTLVRGPQITNPRTGDPWWYPYPFLDPHSPTTGGYGGVVLYVIGIAAAIVAFAFLVVWVGRRRAAAPAQSKA